jgi:hypothetical protein
LDINNHIKKIEHLVPGEMSKADQALILSSLEACLYVIKDLQQTVQELKDEVNRLKGEQGKPTISAKNQQEEENGEDSSRSDQDISSEAERKEKKGKGRKRGVKFDGSQQVTREEVIKIEDKSDLPLDIEFKGYATNHYQNLLITSELIVVKQEIYYSPSQGKTYKAELPLEYEAGYDYTQELKGHILMLKFEMGLSIPKIGDFLRMNGINISNATVSNTVLAGGAYFQAEKEALHRSGMEVGLYTQTDTTGARVNGENWHTHIMGNAYYSAYFTTPHKDRQTILDILRGEAARFYLLNEDTFELYDYLKIPKKIQEKLETLSLASIVDQDQFVAQLTSALSPKEYEKHGAKLLEGAYLAAYHYDDPLAVLVVDDAPQYKLLALWIALCWVHAGRHFKKLNPIVKHHQAVLDDFLNEFWAYYRALKSYQLHPDLPTAKILDQQFDQLFSRKTGYEQLDERIAKTKLKKKELLVVLKHPYVPLHNNASELDARKEVRYRDISFQTRNQKGTQAKDTMFTIIQTCKKLGVNAYAYVLDRITKRNRMTPLEKIMFNTAKAC